MSNEPIEFRVVEEPTGNLVFEIVREQEFPSETLALYLLGLPCGLTNGLECPKLDEHTRDRWCDPCTARASLESK